MIGRHTVLRNIAMSTVLHAKQVVIVGGVAGGMSCATRLRRLDENAHITVLEKGPFISYANCGIPYALGNVIQDEGKLHVQTNEKIKAWFNIDVRTNAELVSIDRVKKIVHVRETNEKDSATDQTLQQISYDRLVLSLGAEAVKPPIKGIDSDHVFTLQTIPDLEKVKSYIETHHCRHVAVIGGGFIGLETAENLRFLGLDVTVLEYLPHVFPPVDPDMAELLHREMRRHGLHLVLNARITRITAPGGSQHAQIVFDSSDSIRADLIIAAVGVQARTAVAAQAGLSVSRSGLTVNDTMQTSDPDIYAIGDMVETLNLVSGRSDRLALAGPANRQGRLVADHICGRNVHYRGNVGTAICKVFDLTVGSVGFSVEALRRMGRGDRTKYVTIHPSDHASYYPGAEQMTVRVAFEAPSGRLLGAQIVGKHGVDKRIDIFAMAMRAGMTIEDLEHVELGYAPPYGAAKDPVNMAGFVGGNLLRGAVETVHAQDLANEVLTNSQGERQTYTLPDKYQVVDVRSPEEFESGHVIGAMNIPLGTLRTCLGPLDQTKKILVYCRVGYRGYLAYRILKQNGFDVVNLDGGFKSVSDGGYEILEERPENKTEAHI